MAAKLTITKAATPSEEVIEDANRVHHVTDAKNRVIGIRKMNMNVRRRVLKVISGEMASRPQYLGMVMVAACVVEIDGEEIHLPASEMQFDALIDRLDDDGFQAIGKAIKEQFGVGESTDDLKALAGE